MLIFRLKPEATGTRHLKAEATINSSGFQLQPEVKRYSSGFQLQPEVKRHSSGFRL
jgi:hypothetical protein